MANMSIKQKEKLVYNFEKNVDKIHDALASLSSSINELQSGNGKPYWNGANACDFIKTISQQLNTDYNLMDSISKIQKKIKI